MGANAGIVGMTKEHLGLALALSVPVFVVVTKIDMCPPNILQDNLKLLCKVLRSQGCRKVRNSPSGSLKLEFVRKIAIAGTGDGAHTR